MTNRRSWTRTIILTIITKLLTLVVASVIISAVCFIPWGLNTSMFAKWDGFAFSNYFSNLGAYWKTIAAGSSGVTAGGNSIAGELIRVIPRTFTLLGFSLLWGITVGFIAGTLSVVSRRRRARSGLLATTFFALSIPDFFLIVIVQTGILALLRAMNILVLPALASLSVRGMILPAFTLGILPAAYITRLVSITLEEIEREDYMRTAVAKGRTRLEAFVFHALRNIYASILTSLPSVYGMTISSLVIVEYLYVFPGLGNLSINAFRRVYMYGFTYGPDCNLLASACTVFAIVYFLLDIMATIGRAWADPTLRGEVG